jgi:hypothetical protein
MSKKVVLLGVANSWIIPQSCGLETAQAALDKLAISAI